MSDDIEPEPLERHEERRRRLADLRGGDPDEVLDEVERLYASLDELDRLILEEKQKQGEITA